MESVLARICREAGGRVTTDMVRDLNLQDLQGPDGRCLEVTADGFPQLGVAQLAVDTTLVEPFRSCGSARRQAVDSDGAVLDSARRRKERTYP